MQRALELLAPARDALVAREAILHGADAIYIGGPSHGARASASNPIADIAATVRFAHMYGVKVYVTLNTIIYDSEIADVERDVRSLYDCGVDALIVQDMSLLRMDIPPIDLHASTQCDIRTPQKARFLAECGFSQLVLPRELSLDETHAIRDAVGPDTVLEAFVHGALCVSYSGDCQASCVAMGRSANRGECAQMCRLPYSLVDDKGNVLIADKHLLSLRDLNRLADIGVLAEAGISSFKIEGRLKDANYVKHTVAAYRQAIDRLIAQYPDRYRRASYGNTQVTFTPDLNKAFNRGFTSYFTHGRDKADSKMANIDTPKWVGEKVGTVVRSEGGTIIAKLDAELNNGDGIGYYTKTGEYTGFHLNRAERGRLYPATRTDIAPGTVLYRNRDNKAEKMMSQATARRLVSIDMRLSLSADTLTLTLTAENGCTATASTQVEPAAARTPQANARLTALSKLGNTPFVLNGYTDDVAADTFIPASTLSALRQESVDSLIANLIAKHERKMRLPENIAASLPCNVLTYHDNVANNLAENFCREHGATQVERAIETQNRQKGSDVTVMTTRYCLRRQLGACLCTPTADRLPKHLYLKNRHTTYRLDFDCKQCQMRVIATNMAH